MKLLSSLLAAFAFVVMSVLPASSKDFSEAYKATVDGVFQVIIQENSTTVGSGSAFMAAENFFITSSHVVGDAEDIHKIKLVGDDNPARMWLVDKVVYHDVYNDIAILRMSETTYKLFKENENPIVLPLSDSLSTTPGMEFMGIGNRFGYSLHAYFGHVSQTYLNAEDREREIVHFIDSEFYPGDSGGPIVNNEGKVIGIANRIMIHTFGNGEMCVIDQCPTGMIEVITASESIRKAMYDYAYLGAYFDADQGFEVSLVYNRNVTRISTIKGKVMEKYLKPQDGDISFTGPVFGREPYVINSIDDWKFINRLIGYGEKFTVNFTRNGERMSTEVDTRMNGLVFEQEFEQ